MITYTQTLITKFTCEDCGSSWSVEGFDFLDQAFITCIKCAECSEIDPEINEEFKIENKAR